MKTDEELKEIAEDVIGGRIFSDRHIPKGREDELLTVFLPLGLGGPEIADKLKAEKVAFIYEYMSEASPRSVNGLPSFFSFKTLNGEETEKMLEYYRKIKDAIGAVK